MVLLLPMSIAMMGISIIEMVVKLPAIMTTYLSDMFAQENHQFVSLLVEILSGFLLQFISITLLKKPVTTETPLAVMVAVEIAKPLN